MAFWIRAVFWWKDKKAFLTADEANDDNLFYLQRLIGLYGY